MPRSSLAPSLRVCAALSSLAFSFSGTARAAEPTAAQLHVQLADQQKVIASLKARLDKLEAPGHGTRRAVRHPKQKAIGNPPPHAAPPPKPMATRASARSRFTPAGRIKAAQPAAPKQNQVLKIDKNNIPTVEPIAETIAGIRKNVQSLQKAVAKLVEHAAATDGTLIDLNESATQTALYLPSMLQDAKNLANAIAEVDKDMHASFAAAQTSHDELVASTNATVKTVNYLDDANYWMERNVQHVVHVLGCNEYDFLPGDMHGNLAKWNYDCQ